jgi:hypothetical protein
MMSINKQVNVMLETKCLTNTKSLVKENHVPPYFDEKSLTTDTLYIKTLNLDIVESESTSYVLGYN